MLEKLECKEPITSPSIFTVSSKGPTTSSSAFIVNRKGPTTSSLTSIVNSTDNTCSGFPSLVRLTQNPLGGLCELPRDLSFVRICTPIHAPAPSGFQWELETTDCLLPPKQSPYWTESPSVSSHPTHSQPQLSFPLTTHTQPVRTSYVSSPKPHPESHCLSPPAAAWSEMPVVLTCPSAVSSHWRSCSPKCSPAICPQFRSQWDLPRANIICLCLLTSFQWLPYTCPAHKPLVIPPPTFSHRLPLSLLATSLPPVLQARQIFYFPQST